MVDIHKGEIFFLSVFQKFSPIFSGQEFTLAVKKLEGVVNARVNFMTQKFTLEAADDIFDKVFDDAVKACKKVEPDCEIG